MPLYKKKIKYVAETEIRKAAAQAYGDRKEISDDAKNRKYILEKIRKLVREDVDKEKIVEEILKDRVMEKFEYLKSINPDTSVFVRNWVEDAIKKKNKREKQERER